MVKWHPPRNQTIRYSPTQCSQKGGLLQESMPALPVTMWQMSLLAHLMALLAQEIQARELLTSTFRQTARRVDVQAHQRHTLSNLTVDLRKIGWLSVGRSLSREPNSLWLANQAASLMAFAKVRYISSRSIEGVPHVFSDVTRERASRQWLVVRSRRDRRFLKHYEEIGRS